MSTFGAPRTPARILAALLLVAAPAISLGLPAAHAQDAGSPPAAPAAPVSAEVIVLHATNDGTGIDPAVGKMPELTKPPLSSYNSYKLLGKPTLALSKGSPATTTLPNQSVLQVTLKDVIVAPKDAKNKEAPKRYALGASIQNPGGKNFLPLLEVSAKAGETFFVAGQAYKGGILVIGIKVVP